MSNKKYNAQRQGNEEHISMIAGHGEQAQKKIILKTKKKEQAPVKKEKR